MKPIFYALMDISIVIAFALLISSCQINSASDPGEVNNKLTYFKDNSTGLCFATVNSASAGAYQITSIACVPCDSIRHLLK